MFWITEFLFAIALVLGFLCPRILNNKLIILSFGWILSAFSAAALSSKRARFAIKRLSLVVLLLILFGWVNDNVQLKLPFADSEIVLLRGTLISDSSISINGNMVMNVKLSECESSDKTIISASGLILAVGGEKQMLNAGTEVLINGKVAVLDDLETRFISVDSWNVISPRTMLGRLRMWILQFSENRLLGDSFRIGESADDNRSIAAMLLLGRTDSTDVPIRALSEACGCLHILALSGLHLGFFDKSLSFLRKGRLRQISVIILSAFFVLIIGPKSSLLRALILLILSCADQILNTKLSNTSRLALTALLQISLFPYSMQGLGASYSYLAVLGIYLLNTRLQLLLAHLLDYKITTTVSMGISAVFFTCFITINKDGLWYPQAIIISPFASVLVFLMMATAFGILVFPHSLLLLRVLDVLGDLLTDLFRWGGRISMVFDWLSRPISLPLPFILLLTLWLWVRYSEIGQRKKTTDYELGLQLRFANSHQSPS